MTTVVVEMVTNSHPPFPPSPYANVNAATTIQFIIILLLFRPSSARPSRVSTEHRHTHRARTHCRHLHCQRAHHHPGSYIPMPLHTTGNRKNNVRMCSDLKCRSRLLADGRTSITQPGRGLNDFGQDRS